MKTMNEISYVLFISYFLLYNIKHLCTSFPEPNTFIRIDKIKKKFQNFNDWCFHIRSL